MPALRSSAVATSRWLVAGCAAVLVFAALAAYHNTFHVPFLFDDIFSIVENRTIRHLGDFKHVLLPDAGYGVTVSGRPVLNLSLALCYAVSGTNVWSYHALNLLIHILAGLTLFGIVRRTLAEFLGNGCGERRNAGRPVENPTLLAFAMALIWTLHPLQTEAVTYAIQRTESLMGLFFLLTLYGFIRAVTSPRPWSWRVLAVLACLAAVGTKEVAAAVPLLVFLYDRTFVAGTFREAWRRRRWLHLSLAATWLPLALLVASTGWNRGGTAGFNVGVSPWAYWLTQFQAVARYLKQSVWPHPLIFEYGKVWMGFRDAAPFALIVVPLLAATVLALWRWPIAGFLGAWIFAILAPTSFVPGSIQMIVEHRMYLPLAAVIAGVVGGLDAVRRRCLAAPATCRPILRAVQAPIAPWLALAVPLGGLTAQRNAVYQSDLTLWEQTVAQSPASAIAQSSLGTALYERNRVREALPHYLISLGLDPNLASNHFNLGLAYASLHHLPEAVAHYRDSIRINPLYYPADYQLGLALLQMNRPQDAAAAFAETVRLNPNMPDAHYEWGVALAKMGQVTAAIAHFEAALRLDPHLAAAECDLGSALYQLNRVPDAVACYQRALALNPNLADAHFNLGIALAQMGSRDQALAQYAETVRLDPNHAKAHYNLGISLGQTGRLEEALEHLHRAVQLEPGFAEAHYNLGVALDQARRTTEAINEYRAALRLRPAYASAEYSLGYAFLELRRLPEAREHFEAALRIDPQFEPARAILDRIRAGAPER